MRKQKRAVEQNSSKIVALSRNAIILLILRLLVMIRELSRRGAPVALQWISWARLECDAPRHARNKAVSRISYYKLGHCMQNATARQSLKNAG